MLHKASAVAIVVSLCWLVACTSANPSADLFVQLGHTRKVMAVTFSPDGKILASASQDKTIELLGTALIHPDVRAVIPLMPEPIVKQDGRVHGPQRLEAGQCLEGQGNGQSPATAASCWM